MTKSPDAFRTISEVADWLGTPAHVLRFWESKFSQVKPVKRAGGRRYYRPNDMLLLGGLKKVLHEDGLTIKGAQQLLREKGIKHVAGLSQSLDSAQIETIDINPAIEEVPSDPSEVQGLPPQSLATDLGETEPVVELQRELDPEPIDPDFSDHFPDATQTDALPFEDKNLVSNPETHPEPAGEDPEPRADHFLQAAARTIDNSSDADAIPETVPEPKTIAPAGPLNLEGLRIALSGAQVRSSAQIADVALRLTVIRDRISNEANQRP